MKIKVRIQKIKEKKTALIIIKPIDPLITYYQCIFWFVLNLMLVKLYSKLYLWNELNILKKASLFAIK